MDLKFRRNLPLLLLFLAIVTVLMVGLGDQPIVSYTVKTNSADESYSYKEVNLAEAILVYFSPAESASDEITTIESNGAESVESDADVDVSPALDYRIDSSSQGSGQVTFQADEGY